MKFLLFVSLVVVAVSAYQNDFLKVKLNHGGGVVGKYMTTHKGKGIMAYTGIPYAEAPVGNFRFTDPVVKGGWHGFYDGQHKENVVCPQFNTWGKDMITGQEDCLYLNVYVPMVRKIKSLNLQKPE